MDHINLKYDFGKVFKSESMHTYIHTHIHTHVTYCKVIQIEMQVMIYNTAITSYDIMSFVRMRCANQAPEKNRASKHH